MRRCQGLALAVVIGLAALPVWGKEHAVLSVSCGEAIEQAELIAANRKWSSQRPDPTAPVLNISTSANYAKQVLLGSLFSHPKVGELTFDNSAGTQVCAISSNGHPADVVLKDLKKKFANVEPVAPGEPETAEKPAPVAAPSAVAAPPAPAQVPAAAAPMTNADVVALVEAGLPPDVILAKIRATPHRFDTSTAALAHLKGAGVADAVILAMVESANAAPAKP